MVGGGAMTAGGGGGGMTDGGGAATAAAVVRYGTPAVEYSCRDRVLINSPCADHTHNPMIPCK